MIACACFFHEVKAIAAALHVARTVKQPFPCICIAYRKYTADHLPFPICGQKLFFRFGLHQFLISLRRFAAKPRGGAITKLPLKSFIINALYFFIMDALRPYRYCNAHVVAFQAHRMQSPSSVIAFVPMSIMV
jgi:hypothetical protein